MATQIDSLARVYARSLYELAEQAGGRDKIIEVGDEIEQICELARADRGMSEFLRSPIIDKAARSAALNRVFGDRITDLTLRFLLVLNANGRLGHLDVISAAFDQMVHEDFGRVEVDIFTPTPLERSQLESVKARVQTALGKEPVLYPYTDPAMIGGIRLRIGDRLIDASIVTRLRRMRDQLLRGGGAALRARMNRLIDDAGGAAS